MVVLSSVCFLRVHEALGDVEVHLVVTENVDEGRSGGWEMPAVGPVLVSR